MLQTDRQRGSIRRTSIKTGAVLWRRSWRIAVQFAAADDDGAITRTGGSSRFYSTLVYK